MIINYKTKRKRRKKNKTKIPSHAFVVITRAYTSRECPLEKNNNNKKKENKTPRYNIVPTRTCRHEDENF